MDQQFLHDVGAGHSACAGQMTWDNRVLASLADMREAGLWDQADTLSRELLACYAEITALQRRLDTYREASLNHRPPHRTTPLSKSLTSG
jgi:hypothetical protein